MSKSEQANRSVRAVASTAPAKAEAQASTALAGGSMAPEGQGVSPNLIGLLADMRSFAFGAATVTDQGVALLRSAGKENEATAQRAFFIGYMAKKLHPEATALTAELITEALSVLNARGFKTKPENVKPGERVRTEQQEKDYGAARVMWNDIRNKAGFAKPKQAKPAGTAPVIDPASGLPVTASQPRQTEAKPEGEAKGATKAEPAVRRVNTEAEAFAELEGIMALARTFYERNITVNPTLMPGAVATWIEESTAKLKAIMAAKG